MQNEKWIEVDGKWQLTELIRDEFDMQAAHPWRRWFARGLDHSIYVLAWQAIEFLVLYRNISGWLWREIFIGYAAMIVIEPFLLRLFGTTPGKLLFGIRVKSPEGKNITVGQGFERTWRVFFRGYGLSIPIYNIVRLWKSRRHCLTYGKMDWDEDGYENRISVVTVNKRFMALRAASYIAVITLVVTVTLALPLAADMPRHRGELTVEQLHENIHRYWRYHRLDRAWNVWGGDGFIVTDIYGNVIPQRVERRDLLGWTPPELTIHEESGIVTGVSFEVDNESAWGRVTLEMREWARALAVTFIGAQSGVTFWDMHLSGGALDTMEPIIALSWVTDRTTREDHIISGVRVTWHSVIDWDTGVFNGYFHMMIQEGE